MRPSGLQGSVELDVGELGSADDPLLGFAGQCGLCVKVMQEFLLDHVAPVGECPILDADDGRLDRARSVTHYREQPLLKHALHRTLTPNTIAAA